VPTGITKLIIASALIATVLISAAPAGAAAGGKGVTKRACAAGIGHAVRCDAIIASNSTRTLQASPNGLSPSQVLAAYSFPTNPSAGAGKTIAIVDAFDDPTAQRDLNTFDATYGLPACTAANGCFTKLSQSGTTTMPPVDSGWALEASLDIQWAHAVAPGAHILLVEAHIDTFAALMKAEDYASAHAQYVSNSWGAGEFPGETSYDSHFTKPGVSYFAASGDSGLGPDYPSTAPTVISVGGTTLQMSGNSVLSEVGWAWGGGGCSSLESAPLAQLAFTASAATGCGTRRSTPDVSLVADPSTGVSVYDSTGDSTSAGWFTVGGTSAAAPMLAARAAVAGVQMTPSYLYGSSISFRDITAGGNSAGCRVGFDLCSGRGSWIG